MCYDIAQYTKRSLDYAKRYGEDPEHIERLEEVYRKKLKLVEPLFHASGFEHPHVLAHLNTTPLQPKFLYWGLIPPWTIDQQTALQVSYKTLNARVETMFEKSSYEMAAKTKRCLITLDGFYEHHHFKGKTYPYFIQHKDESPLVVAGLWESWVNPATGKAILSASIVTTKANALMKRIHNNPKAKEARMPLLLSKNNQQNWLSKEEGSTLVDIIEDLSKPYPEEELKAYTVGKLRGKSALGNVKQAMQEVSYPEFQQGELF